MTPTLPPGLDDETVRSLLARVRRIAVIGLSPKPHRDSHRVSSYMQRQGYEIVPVYPRENLILGQPVHGSVRDIEAPVDLVNVFRRSEELPGVVADILDSKSAERAAVWFQLDCIHAGAFAELTKAGRTVVYDRCLMVEHARLLRSR
jgi:predicted CoA-binding protein